MLVLNSLKREIINSNLNKRLRKYGFITANLYNVNVNIPIKIFYESKKEKFIKGFLKKRILLNFKNKKLPVILQEISIQPVNGTIINIDLVLI